MNGSREIVLGANSKVWRALALRRGVAERFAIAIGHAQLDRFEFASSDRVWVFAYSRRVDENRGLLRRLRAAGVREVVYVSSATVNVTRLTSCFQYPRVKKIAEEQARAELCARVVTLGIVYESRSELPGGVSAATSLDSIESFLLAPRWPVDNANVRLFELVATPFARQWEACLHRWYDAVQWRVRRWPCVLRPIDFVLRACGMRWYGYVNLSNRLWNSTK